MLSRYRAIVVTSLHKPPRAPECVNKPVAQSAAQRGKGRVSVELLTRLVLRSSQLNTSNGCIAYLRISPGLWLMVLSLHRCWCCVYPARSPKQTRYLPLSCPPRYTGFFNTLHRRTLNSLENSAPTSKTCPPDGDWFRALMKNLNLCPESYITDVCVVRSLQ